MPLYEYECAACGHRFEQIRKFSDPPIDVCPKCGQAQVQKLLSSPAIQFKGTGWYITDYARKGAAGGETGSKSSDKNDKDTKDGKSDTKSDSKSTASESASSTASSGSSDAAPATPAKSS